MNKCRICADVLYSDLAKTCKSLKCKSAWKMERNKNLVPTIKLCLHCSIEFSTKDKRSNFCSTVCKSVIANKTKLEKYGTLSLESKESILNRINKAKTTKIKCSIEGCDLYSRNRGMCASHYIKHHYLKTLEGIETYRLHSQKRRHFDRNTKTLLKCELQFLRKIQTTCAKCNINKDLTIDHHIPLSKGGKLSLYNTVLLCHSCNSKKHNKLPEHFYTFDELETIQDRFNLIAEHRKNLPNVFFLFGCFGAGKTWVGNQLINNFFIVEYDKYRFKSVEIIDALPKTKPILFISSIGITAFMNKYGMKYNIVPIALIESSDVIRQRLIQRGGSMTANVERRLKRVESISNKYAEFSGTSNQVLEYLKN